MGYRAQALLSTSTDQATPAPTFDLQSHSLHSDGALAPRAVVAAARDTGVELFALTDHDTVGGVQEAAEAAACMGLRLVPAVEISAIGFAERDLHILGYLVDPGSRELGRALARFRSDRDRRARAMAKVLESLGFQLDWRPLQARIDAGKPIGRPHLAQAVVAHPGNERRLAREGKSSPSLFLEAYLAEGRPAFEHRLTPSVQEAIETIHSAGGVAVWAHPFWGLEGDEAVARAIDVFRSWGLDGVECFYPTHTRSQTEFLHDRCASLGLLATGSSDFHGPQHSLFSRFRAFSTYGRRPILGPLVR
jgi:predicted metal-dependent phosphoesterase TrpH